MQELKGVIGPQEFFRWMALFQEEEEIKKRHSRQEYFLAMIAFQTYLARISFSGTNGQKQLQFEDFLLKFSEKEDLDRLLEEEDLEVIKAEKKRRSSASKSAWSIFTGLGKDGKIPPGSSKISTKGHIPKPKRKPPKARSGEG